MLKFDQNSQPFQLADSTLHTWSKVWAHHGLGAPRLPEGAQSWNVLPPISADQVPTVIRKFSVKTASGPTRLAPRCLDVLSDGALQAIADMYMLFEKWLCWPMNRIYSEFVRPSKPDGDTRLIVLSNTLVRVWGKVRRPIFLASGRSDTDVAKCGGPDRARLRATPRSTITFTRR